VQPHIFEPKAQSQKRQVPILNESPLVSVVMPTWNRLPFVEEAARSVIAQTYRRWELVVIDDGSDDGTAERLNGLNDSRIKVLSSPHVGHIGQLRNRGVAAASGELIAFLDSDDVWMPRKLEVQLRAIRESGAGWCYSSFEMMDANGRPIPLPSDKIHLPSGDIVREMLTFWASVKTPTVVVKRDVFEAAGRFSQSPRLRVGEDYELYMRFALRSPAIAVAERLARIREHQGRTTAMGHHDPYELKQLIYEVFLASCTDTKYTRLARRLLARNLADAGAHRLSAGKLKLAAMLLGQSARHGVDVKYLARAFARGMRDRLLGCSRPGGRQ
jgi:glycosyltransferase involved in cell wall biosynthesis